MTGTGIFRALGAAVVAAWLVSPSAVAQTTGVEAEPMIRAIERGPDELKTERDRVRDHDVVETALVITNTRKQRASVICVGKNHQGRTVGRTLLQVPPRGLRYVRASDVSNGLDFIGSVNCRTGGHVLGSVLLFGLGPTDLRVVQHEGEGAALIQFPLVLSF